jgi:hypothetical protein
MVEISKENIRPTNMTDFEVKTCVGMGDLVLNFAQLETVKNDFTEIRVCPAYSLLNEYRSGSPELHAFTKQFAQLLFDKPPYKLIDSSSAPLTPPDVLLCQRGWKASYVDLSDRLCLAPVDIGVENYVIIQTKVRHLNREVFNSISERFFSTIRNIKNCKIVLMGEHNTGSCKESKIHNDIFIIYDELKKALEGIDHIDLTKEVLLDSPNLDDLRKDLTIMRNARCVVVFGISGIVTTIAATAKKVAGFRTDTLEVINNFFSPMDKKEKMITHNFEQFITFIENSTN